MCYKSLTTPYHSITVEEKQAYDTAQLQGNIRTYLERVQYVSRTHMRTCLKYMQDTSRTCTRHIHASAKPRDKAAVSRFM